MHIDLSINVFLDIENHHIGIDADDDVFWSMIPKLYIFRSRFQGKYLKHGIRLSGNEPGKSGSRINY